jgi:hypothetical protein
MIDPDKIPDVPFVSMIVHGVTLQSRYGKRKEYETMQAVVKHLPPFEREKINSIFCDSKACSQYEVELNEYDGTNRLACLLDKAFVAVAGGYNGIFLGCGGINCGFLDPYWDEDYFDDEPAA